MFAGTEHHFCRKILARLVLLNALLILPTDENMPAFPNQQTKHWTVGDGHTQQVCKKNRHPFKDGFHYGWVVIRSAERYDEVKIKPTESEAEHWFCLYDSIAYDLVKTTIVGVGSRSGRINPSQCSISGHVIGWLLCFCFRFWRLVFTESFRM